MRSLHSCPSSPPPRGAAPPPPPRGRPPPLPPPRAAADQAAALRRASRGLLAALRPEAVALVDAFGFEDYYLNSALGR
jgi:hypothetical protein